MCEKDAKEKRKGFILRGNVDWMGREEEKMSFVASGPACMVKAQHLGSDGACPLFFFSCPSDTFSAPSHLSFFPPRSIILMACAVSRRPSLALHGSQDRLVSTIGPHVESLLFPVPCQSVDWRANPQCKLAYASVRTRWPVK